MIHFCRDSFNLFATKLLHTPVYKQQIGPQAANDVCTNFITILNKLIHRFAVDLQFSNQNNDNQITINYASWLNDPSYAGQKPMRWDSPPMHPSPSQRSMVAGAVLGRSSCRTP